MGDLDLVAGIVLWYSVICNLAVKFRDQFGLMIPV